MTISSSPASQFLSVSDEVADAVARSLPVVALETTIITHGMPWPENYETAMSVEQVVRDAGAIPAAIAVKNGRIRVGLTGDELRALSQESGVLKLTTADLAYGLISGKTGATTVAATMVTARLAGIGVFCTGGIGGVHRGAQDTFDVSADLTELGRTDVIVVSAGPKALLDIPKTLERLETLAVPVICYKTDWMPAFWSRSSGLPAPIRLDSAADIAAFVAAQSRLGLSGGVLVANPVPAGDEIPADEMGPKIELAIAQAKAAGVRGKAVTPWLLDAILKGTEGRSLTTNIALVKNNASLAARIAIAVAQT